MQPTSDRRHRKKKAVREALENAALRLFDEKGFSATTIEAIAEEADVSRSTFFRYFGSKEAVLFAGYDENGEHLARLILERPPEEPPLVAFENAFVALVDVPDVARPSDHTDRQQRIIESDPALKSKSDELIRRWRGRIAERLAEREGLREPRREHILVAAIGIAIAERVRDEYVDPKTTGDFSSLIRSQFDLLRRIVAPG